MKLILAVIHRRDMPHLHDRLVAEEFRFTELSSAGGFLGAGNVTLLMGLEDERVERAIDLVKATCRSREETVGLTPANTRLYADTVGEAVTVPIGGAQVFVLNIERAEHV